MITTNRRTATPLADASAGVVSGEARTAARPRPVRTARARAQRHRPGFQRGDLIQAVWCSSSGAAAGWCRSGSPGRNRPRRWQVNQPGLLRRPRPRQQLGDGSDHLVRAGFTTSSATARRSRCHAAVRPTPLGDEGQGRPETGLGHQGHAPSYGTARPAEAPARPAPGPAAVR